MFFFSEYLKSLREQQRMSLRDVERRTEVSNAYLSQIELGKRPPPHPNILKKLAPIYDVSVYELMAAAGYLDEAQGKSSMRYKCLNPACRHEWETRGEYVKNLRCPRCHTGYVVEKYIFDEAVAEDRKVLEYASSTKAYEVYLDALSNVVRKLFPMLPFNPFQVIYEKAKGGLK
ncbi:hypothetical protein ES705_40610 [subsurface metagenome]